MPKHLNRYPRKRCECNDHGHGRGNTGRCHARTGRDVDTNVNVNVGPVVSGRTAARAFERIGNIVIRQRGSHIRLRDDENPKHLPLTIPDHRELKPGLLGQLLQDANLTVEEFVELLGRNLHGVRVIDEVTQNHGPER